ncbi:MAG: hypothetical protein ACYCVM_10925 [Acidiferrobacter sp.]
MALAIMGPLTASLALLLQYHDLRHLLFVFAAFGLGKMMEGIGLGPGLAGRSVGLHPVRVIFVVLTGAVCWVSLAFCPPCRFRPC